MGSSKKHDALKWVQNLYQNGIRVYIFKNLDEKYKDTGLHLKAATVGYIIKIYKNKDNDAVYIIRDDIMQLTFRHKISRPPNEINYNPWHEDSESLLNDDAFLNTFLDG